MTALFHLEQCGYLIANIYKKTFCTSNILNNFIFLFCLPMCNGGCPIKKNYNALIGTHKRLQRILVGDAYWLQQAYYGGQHSRYQDDVVYLLQPSYQSPLIAENQSV